MSLQVHSRSSEMTRFNRNSITSFKRFVLLTVFIWYLSEIGNHNFIDLEG